jgi:hypothetical protein
VLKLLVEHLLDRTNDYGITPQEFQKLRAFQKQLDQADKQPLDQTRSGAGTGSVILSAERFTPSEG